MIRLALIVLLALQGCANGDEKSPRSSAVNESEEVGMPKAEMLPALKKKAIEGGKAEALQLSLWYFKFPQGDDTFEYWTQIAAENGSATAQYNLSQYYTSFGTGPYSKERARFWLKKAAEQGDAAAKEALAEYSSESK